MSQLKILIVDDQPDLVEFIALFLSNEFDAELIKEASPLAAVEKINSLKNQLSLIISDYNMPKVNGGKLFEIARSVNPNIPFILLTSELKEKHQHIFAQPHTAYISKPFTEKQINSTVRSLLNQGEIPGPLKFIPVSIECLFLINKITKPLFTKSEEGNFVKVMDTGVEFAEISYENYKQKGELQLYVEKENFHALIGDFKEKTLSNMLFNKINQIDSQSVKVSANIVGLLTDTVKAFGFDDRTQELIKKNVEMVKFLSDSTPEINKLFKWHDATDKDYSGHHSLLISCLTTAFCKEHQFNHPQANEILSLAAFFHDIALDSYVVKNEVRFIKAMKLNIQANKDEIALVKLHPNQARLSLMEWPHCPPELINIVLHHHEQPNGEGFPSGLKANQIDELTACFIIAEEMVELYLNKKAKGLVLKHMQLLEAEYNKEQFKPFYQIALKWLSSKNIAF
jgi:response regulator RpfG family c-di-GMP phosphodiesterase